MAASALTEFATHSELVQQESAGSAVCTSNFVSRLWFSQVSMRVSLLIKTSQLQASNPGPAIPYNLAQFQCIFTLLGEPVGKKEDQMKVVWVGQSLLEPTAVVLLKVPTFPILDQAPLTAIILQT